MPDGTLPLYRRTEAAEALRMAEVRLMQAQDQTGWDCAAQTCVSDAAGFLRAAGCGDLADRLEEDAWGGDVAGALAEVTAMRKRG